MSTDKPREAPFDYWPLLGRPKLKLPNGANIAVWVGMNIEHFPIDRPGMSINPRMAEYVPDPANYGWRSYGMRVGIWRFLDAVDKYSLPVSVLLNSDVCKFYPELIQEGIKRNWVWLAHGKNNTILEVKMELEEERKYLTDVVSIIEKSTGKKPRGWLGPSLSETFNTPQVLSDLGLTYLCDWCNDDEPYPLNIPNRRMISVPYSIEINDAEIFYRKGLDGQGFYQAVKDQFDTLYEEGQDSGKIMAICIHPFLTSLPFRHKYFCKAIEYIKSHEKVWLTTSDEIAEWYFKNYYDEAVKRISERKKKFFG